MIVTTAMVDEINDVLRGIAVPNHYLTRTAGQSFILYGMDDPQRTYLAVDHFRIHGFPAVGGRTPAESIERRAVGTGDKQRGQYDKRESPKVSNYVLHFNPKNVVVTERPTHEMDLQRPAQVDKKMPAREASRQAFTGAFNGSGFSLSSIGNDPDKLMRGVRKDHGNVPLTMGLDVVAHNGALRNFAVRRACKFLIYEAAQDGKQVAYALDDMDLAAVANKQWRDWDLSAFVDEAALHPGSNAKVPVCTSEIREIFRGWDFLKDHVTFYEGFNRVNPPWERDTEREAWGSYARVLGRHLLRTQQAAPLLGNVRAIAEWCISSKQAKDAIERYHRCHASVFRGKHAVVPVHF
jgi:hypothetical protein